MLQVSWIMSSSMSMVFIGLSNGNGKDNGKRAEKETTYSFNEPIHYVLACFVTSLGWIGLSGSLSNPSLRTAISLFI